MAVEHCSVTHYTDRGSQTDVAVVFESESASNRGIAAETTTML